VNKAYRGHGNGLLFDSFYYTPLSEKMVMQQYVPLPMAHDWYRREYPTSWRNIDHGINWFSSLS
jgi:hypothetical protein